MPTRKLALLIGLLASLVPPARSAEPSFTVGSSGVDITPPPGLPMWGYAARHDAPSIGTLDPLQARAVVIEANGTKLAIVGLDLGRGPTPSMMATIRAGAARAGIAHVLVAGSHTHHGPVLELADRPGMGTGKYEAAVLYAKTLPGLIVDAILAADRDRRPARIGVDNRQVNLNRNRHTKREPKPVDHGLIIVRLDDLAGKPIAVLVNFAAHPTTTRAADLRYSADYVGAMRGLVERELATRCVFLQGASGDLSTKSPPGVEGTRAFGEALGTQVIDVFRTIRPEAPTDPSIAAKSETFRFRTRIDLVNPLVTSAYSRAFFPELIASMADEFGKGVEAELNTVLLNGKVAIVAGSGEFFCNHANRLRERSRFDQTLFLGYCNGHHMYFPTIEAAYEGGYGADPGTSLAELGAGELMMNRALISLYKLQGRLAAER